MARLSRPAAILATATMGGAVLVSTLPTWVRATTPTATGDLAVTAAGTAASPAAASAGLVVIAAALVLGLAGRAMRFIALVVVIAASAGAAFTVMSFLRTPDVVAASAAAEMTSVRAVNTPVSVTIWPYLSLAILILAAVMAVWILTHLGTWQRVGRRYETTADASFDHEAQHGDDRTRARLRAMDDWDAISRGEDPS